MLEPVASKNTYPCCVHVDGRRGILLLRNFASAVRIEFVRHAQHLE